MDMHWNDDALEQYRQTGDTDVDQLVDSVLPESGSESVGRLGYNEMLVLADQLIKTPELAFVKQSKFAARLSEKPANLVDYFDPMPAPDWVDPAKIKLAARLWQENTLPTLIVLYSASLPACYLVKNGIPALYQTDKLRKVDYIFQRIYETGLMLADTMDPGGINIIEDIDFDDDKLLEQALKNLDSEGNWQQQGRLCHRESNGTGVTLAQQDVQSEIDRLSAQSKRYIWGKGYLAAKKVRFLHASMRFMLNSPHRCCPFGHAENPKSLAETLSQREQAWDSQKLGVPINQEDLAYTLLTFGYLIPRGLAKWGIPVSLEEKEAFLHLWKVIGYIMGIEPALMTDEWNEAELLFEKIKQRQAGYSEDGVALTDTLMKFLADYLPHVPGFSDRLSTVLMINQLGLESASYIIPEAEINATNRWWRRAFYWVAGKICRLFFRLRSRIFKRFTHLGGMTFGRLHEVGHHLIESWRGAYLRKPFFVPKDSTTWIRTPGFNAEHAKKLKNWRRELFFAVAACLVLLIVAVFSFAAAFPLWLFMGKSMFLNLIVVALTTWISSMLLMNAWLPVIFRKRPQITA